MSHAVGIEHGVPKAVFQDTRTRRFTCRIDPVGNLEIGSNTARPELVLDDGSAEFLEGVLRAYRTTRTLSDPGPSRDALAAAVEDIAAKIDRFEADARVAVIALSTRCGRLEKAVEDERQRKLSRTWQQEYADF